MKRECLLSKSYTGAPMMLAGRQLAYSPLVNEILRELDTAFFTGAKEHQTDVNGMAEGIMIMWHLANEAHDLIHRHRSLSAIERQREVVSFYIDHEAEVDALKPALLDRINAAMAAAVESEAVGKSPQPAPASSPS